MSHSLNDPKAADFMKRTSQFSTHGSRRGYVDDGSYILETDFNREALVLRKKLLEKEISDFRRKHNINKHITLVSLKIPTAAHHDIRTLKKLKRIRAYTKEELGKVLAKAEEVAELSKLLNKMPRSRKIHKNTSDQICEILKERSPELYEALEIEALKQIARATAEAVRRDQLDNYST